MNEMRHTVLVVDDTPANIDVVKGILYPNYRIQAANRGEVALDLVARRKPSLILLDVMMPSMDGHEVCHRLKDDPNTKEIPIIFLTAKGQVEDEARGFKLGAADYITKPVNPAILSERVATHIALSDQRQELAEALSNMEQSIQYASRIQRAILPETRSLESFSEDFFILWEPRDLVGGDTYWCRPWGDGILLILADCTGHGVPGAFVTLVGNGALDAALGSAPSGDTAALLAAMHRNVKLVFKQDHEEGLSDDGMEAIVCFIDPKGDILRSSSAGLSLFVMENDEVEEVKGDKMGIGYRRTPLDITFRTQEVAGLKDKSFYMTTDGLTDQIGGDRRRMFGRKRFKELLMRNKETDLSGQRQAIIDALEDYQGDEKRRDDVTVIGFKV